MIFIVLYTLSVANGSIRYEKSFNMLCWGKEWQKLLSITWLLFGLENRRKNIQIINDDIWLLFYVAFLCYRVNKYNNCLNTLGERDFALLEPVPGPRLAGTTDHQAILQGKSSSFSFGYT